MGTLSVIFSFLREIIEEKVVISKKIFLYRTFSVFEINVFPLSLKISLFYFIINVGALMSAFQIR